MAGIGAFLLRNWQAVIGIVAVALLATLLFIRTGERDGARAERDQAVADHIVFAERVRAKADAITAKASAHALAVERQQTQISQEVSREYQERIDDARRRAAALAARLPVAKGRTDPGRSHGADLPGLPDAAGRADAAACEARFPVPDALIATEQAIRLDALQGWLRRQQAVDRTPPAVEE